MSKPPIIDRKTLKQPDAFQAQGMSVFDWILHHRRIWLPVLVGAFVVALGIYALDGYQQHKLNKGWLEYFTALKKPEAERSAALKTVAESWKKIRPGYFAAVAMGDMAFDEARKETLKDSTKPAPSASKAVEWYSTALAFGELLPAERQMLFLNRGQAKEIEKKMDEASQDFKTASEFTGEGKPLALLAMARTEELKAQTPKAIEIYEKISVEFPNTEFAKSAKMQVRRLKSPLFAADKGAVKKG